MITAGVDIGSITTKTVILKDGSLLSSNIIRTGAYSKHSGIKCLKIALDKVSLDLNDVNYIVSTGYGRANIECANKQITEISCHGTGASHLFPGTRTVIDIGGQDSKAISLNEDGEVKDFVMNDKCAAGTGRFLEVMANALEIDIDKMGGISLLTDNEISISSMCAVFAESEVVSLLAEGCPIESISKGLHNAIVERVLSMANKIGIKEPMTLTGGVIKNIGVIIAIKNRLGINFKVSVPNDPQIVGAYGAAMLAHKQLLKESKKRNIHTSEQITHI